jgi:hypothetical protein
MDSACRLLLRVYADGEPGSFCSAGHAAEVMHAPTRARTLPSQDVALGNSRIHVCRTSSPTDVASPPSPAETRGPTSGSRAAGCEGKNKSPARVPPRVLGGERSWEQFEGRNVLGPHDSEMASVDGRELVDRESLGGRDDRSVDRTERQIVVASHELSDPQQV